MMLCSFIFIGLLSSGWGGLIHSPNYGLQPLPRNSRIVGGIETTIESFPHQVSLRYFSWHRCGGSIVRADTILTAAHCVDGIPLINMAFVAGSSDVNNGGESKGLQKVMVHENYNDWTVEFDVAVVLLKSGFEFSEKIQPIALARTGEELAAGSKVIVSGWGTVAENGAEPDILRYVVVNVVESKDCAKAYDGISTVTPNMLCAGVNGGGKDACQGDSGGPLIEGNILYGIVSWGRGCARADFPGVYTKVGAVRDWIDSKMDSSNSSKSNQ